MIIDLNKLKREWKTFVWGLVGILVETVRYDNFGYTGQTKATGWTLGTYA